jgi:hypothetical protein
MDNRHIWFLIDLPEGRLSAAFFPSGRALIDTTGNAGPRQEIGVYEFQLGTDTYQQLQLLMVKARLDTIPSLPSIAPGTKTTSIGETLDGKNFTMKTSLLGQVPPTVQPIVDRAGRGADEVMKHPKRVLQGSGAPLEPAFRRGDPLAFRIVLKNVGTEALETHNPLAGSDSNWTGMQLVITRDVSPDQSKGADSAWIDLQPQHVQPEAGTKRAGGERLELQPGASLPFLVRHKVMTGPGRYRASLRYMAQETQGQRRAIRGALLVDLGAFEILRQ